jgi:NarL family two-component system response regulator LiaR
MDLDMPGMDGISATRAIHQEWPQLKVIALVSLLEEETIQRVLQAGAINYLYKDISADKLANTIRAAHLGLKNDSTFQGTKREGDNAQTDTHPVGNSR